MSFSQGPGPIATTKGYNQGDHQQQHHTRRLVTPPPSQKIAVHQPGRRNRDEAPPSYHQIAIPSTSANSYAYQDPTEV